MIVIATNISNILKMADTTADPVAGVNEDLEDGEIESDGEDTVENHIEEKKDLESEAVPQSLPDERQDQPIYYSKSGKKKKSKNHKSEQRFKEKNKRYRKYDIPAEDDFVGNIEKAIRKVLNKSDDNDQQNQDENDERKKHKKRKKYDSKDSPGKKRRKQEYPDEVDESEMMCVRGASPVQRHSPPMDQDDNQDSYASDSSRDSRSHHSRPQRQRPHQRDRKSKGDRDRRRGVHPMQDPDGVCLYFMQGKCHKGDDCVYSHNAQPPRKMELCKFYLMDCCAKRDKCLYMHSDFPCKYYHTGLPCMYKDECKFAHGKPLTESLKMILLKHIESAPKEILGDFPRLNREGAMMMIANTQAKLTQQFSSEHVENQDKNIPSLFDLNIAKPENIQESPALSPNNFNKEKFNKNASKVRQSRWQNDNYPMNFNNATPTNHSNTFDVLSIKNLTGVLTPRQISDLTKMGIENLDQLNQLSVLQLNTLGLTLKQINEIQLNALSIQKLGLINANSDVSLGTQIFLNPISASKDLDLRVAPMATVNTTAAVTVELPGKDVDMRFQPPLTVSVTDGHNENVKTIQPSESKQNKDTIDIDQYTKDALKFVSKEKQHEDIHSEVYDNNEKINRNIHNETKDTDHRVLQFPQNESLLPNQHASNTNKELDTDIRFLQPDTYLRHAAKRNRRSTTDDDDDNNLLIDEKWYSSDEEKGSKRKSPSSSPRPSSPVQTRDQSAHLTEPASVLNKLGDLSKIAIPEEVTKLLNTLKNNLQENKISEQILVNDVPKDPRNISKKSPEHKMNELLKTQRKLSRPSIYECIEGEPTDGRRRSDVDLRQTDYKLPTFGDTDLRQSSSGDIDFRLGLPFKPIPNYTPASEINGSINCHPPIPYKLIPIDIPRPDYTDIRNSTAKSQALLDPRLRKVFRLSIEDSNSDSEKSVKTSSVPRVDPRRKPKETNEIVANEIKTLDLQTVVQNSNWYKDLSSTQKIFVNQHLATVTSMIKQYQQDKTVGKKFDLTPIQTNPTLCNIFLNLGVSLNENAEFVCLPKPKEALLKTPINYSQNVTPFGINNNMGGVPCMDTGSMNVMNMPHMGMNNMGPMNNMNMGHMPSLNPNFQDIRGGGPTPGLLGIAPNIPHNFDNSQFGGRNNFGNPHFNGPNQGGVEADQNFQRFSNRGGYRGRGNDRWNRGGGGGRGQRDRKNMDRGGGGWKSERH